MLKTVRRMLGLLRPYRWPFAISQVAMLIAAAAGLAFPWAVGRIFGALFEPTTQDPRALALAVILLAGVYAIKEGASFWKSTALGAIGQRMIRDLRAQVYEKMLQLSLDYVQDRGSGEIASSMSNDINLVQQGLSSGLTFVLQQALSLIAVIAMLARTDLVLTGAVLGTVPLIMLVSRHMGSRARKISASMQERLGAMMSLISESLSGLDVIKAFVLESYALGLFRDQNERILKKSVEGIRVGAAASLAVGLLNSVFFVLVIGLGAFRVTAGFLSAAELVSFILYAEMVAGPIATLSGLYVELNRTVAAFERVSAILDARNDIPTSANAARPGRLRGEIEFRHVGFSYDGHREVLSDINLSILPGQRIALVGPSGGGKSTLLKLIPRFYEASRGAVLIDGIDVRDMDLQMLRSQLAVVPQETHLFGFSIRDNIACGRPDASLPEIVRAAQLANADAFICALERGYDTMVGENGARLSGGQRQRIAIARAFLKDPQILLLDEATSALDTEAESQVQNALDTLMSGRTTVIIAHRLSTIESADRIAVMEAGRVLAVGTHAELLRSCVVYRGLYEKQFAHQTASAHLPAIGIPVHARS